jgi:hypothetical protein
MRTALVIILLLAILAGAIFVGHYGWVSAGDVAMPAWGWLMMGLGIFFTLLVGSGLMALVFYIAVPASTSRLRSYKKRSIEQPSGRR